MTGIGRMQIDQADYARDAKKENSMCAMALCTGKPYEQAPKGWGTGRYGGSRLCKKHYREVVDSLLTSLINDGHAPWEDRG